MTSPKDTPMSETEVTQADREFAARFIARSDGDFAELAALFQEYRITHTTPSDVALRWENDPNNEASDLILGGKRVAGAYLTARSAIWIATFMGTVVGVFPTLTEARTAAEQAVRDWLARAGLALKTHIERTERGN